MNVIKKIRQEIETQIDFEKQRDLSKSTWTEEYRKGFIAGLNNFEFISSKKFSEKINEIWNEEYTEGFIDGLKRLGEIIRQETI